MGDVLGTKYSTCRFWKPLGLYVQFDICCVLVTVLQEVYTTQVELRDLEPHTEYLVQVAVSNYYTEYLSEAMSDPLKFITKPGGETPERNCFNDDDDDIMMMMMMIIIDYYGVPSRKSPENPQ